MATAPHRRPRGSKRSPICSLDTAHPVPPRTFPSQFVHVHVLCYTSTSHQPPVLPAATATSCSCQLLHQRQYPVSSQVSVVVGAAVAVATEAGAVIRGGTQITLWKAGQLPSYSRFGVYTRMAHADIDP
jgi:hypothetical protein